MPQLHGLFVKFAGAPVAPFTGYNNTLVMGGLVLSVALAFPVWLGTRGLIIYYRKNLQQKLEKARIIKILNLGNVINFLKGVEQK